MNGYLPNNHEYARRLACSHLDLAQLLAATGRSQGAEDAEREALRVYTKAVDDHPDNADLYHNRGQAYAELGRWAEAAED